MKGLQVINALENWSAQSMKMMGESGFLGSLLNFPKDAINDETCEFLDAYFDSPDFDAELAAKASGAAAGCATGPWR